jgi:hypothetical protein
MLNNNERIKENKLLSSFYNDVEKLHEKAKQIKGPLVVYVEVLKQRLLEYKQRPMKYIDNK